MSKRLVEEHVECSFISLQSENILNFIQSMVLFIPILLGVDRKTFMKSSESDIHQHAVHTKFPLNWMNWTLYTTRCSVWTVSRQAEFYRAENKFTQTWLNGRKYFIIRCTLCTPSIAEGSWINSLEISLESHCQWFYSTLTHKVEIFRAFPLNKFSTWMHLTWTELQTTTVNVKSSGVGSGGIFEFTNPSSMHQRYWPAVHCIHNLATTYRDCGTSRDFANPRIVIISRFSLALKFSINCCADFIAF